MIGAVAWKLGMPETWMFLSFMIVTVVHLVAMSNAALFLRRGRRLFSRWYGGERTAQGDLGIRVTFVIAPLRR